MTRKREEPKYHSYRDLPSYLYSEPVLPVEFRRFCEEHILPRVALTGNKLEDQRRLVMHCVNNLITTGLVSAVVGDTRRTNKPGVRMRVRVWDALIAAKLARVCKGSEMSGKQSRYRATQRLLDLRKQWTLKELIDVRLARNSQREDPTPFALVFLHTGKYDLATGDILPDEQQRQPINFPGVDLPSERNARKHFEGVEDLIEKINRNISSFAFQAFQVDPRTGKERVFEVNACLREIHVGEFFRATRLYSWSALSGQNLTKEMRRRMLIAGEKVVELDFQCMTLRLLYHQHQLNPKGDLYFPVKILPTWHGFRGATAAKKAVVREFIKKATIICLNVASRAKANSAVGHMLVEHADAKFLKKVLAADDCTGAKGLIDRILKVHAEVADSFFTERGLELMTVDGAIMKHIQLRFAEAQKPALSIHDGLVVRASDAHFAKEVMTSTYRLFTNFPPVITSAS